MEQLKLDSLKVGQLNEQFIYASSGKMLLTAGAAISPEDLSGLRQWSRAVLYKLSPQEHQAVLAAKREGAAFDPGREHKAINPGSLKEGDRLEADAYKVGNFLLWVPEGRTLTSAQVDQIRKMGGQPPETIFRLAGESVSSYGDFVTVAVSTYRNRQQRQGPARPVAQAKPRNFETERTEAKQKVAQIPADAKMGDLMKRTPTAWTPQRVQQMNKALGENMDQLEKTVSTDAQTGGPRLSTGALRSHMSIVQDNLGLLMNDGNVLMGLLNAKSDTTHLYAQSCKESVLATEVAAAMNMSKQDVLNVGLLALLHDIGMARVPESVITKLSPLNTEEFAEIRKHPLYSGEMVSNQNGIPRVVQETVGQVHERRDGSGYPQGLKAEEVHSFAKVVAVVDAYTAMISPRPYRPTVLPYHAVIILLRSAYHKLFDRDVVKTLIGCLSLCPIGTVVQLNTGEVGQVIGSHKEAFTRPVLRILYDKDGSRVSVERIVDMLKSEDLEIAQTIRAEDLKEENERVVLNSGSWHEVYNIRAT